jgi:hypothetical protein
VDLIARIIAAAVSFVVGIIGNIFAHDICQSADGVCIRIIRAAAYRLAKADRAPVEQEWIAGLLEYETVFEKYRHAVGCYLVAPTMKRRAFETPPVVDGAPGLFWKLRPNKVWEGRWRSPVEALQTGYVVKSVKLISIEGHFLSAEDQALIVQVANELQADVNQWLRAHGKI